MRGAEFSFVVIVGSFVAGMAAAPAAELPPGPNRDLVAHECTACHDLDMVVATHETREIWINLLDAMTSYGLRVSPEDRAKILEYLVTAQGPEKAEKAP
jgi:hypothetical protein